MNIGDMVTITSNHNTTARFNGQVGTIFRDEDNGRTYGVTFADEVSRLVHYFPIAELALTVTEYAVKSAGTPESVWSAWTPRDRAEAEQFLAEMIEDGTDAEIVSRTVTYSDWS